MGSWRTSPTIKNRAYIYRGNEVVYIDDLLKQLNEIEDRNSKHHGLDEKIRVGNVFRFTAPNHPSDGLKCQIIDIDEEKIYFRTVGSGLTVKFDVQRKNMMGANLKFWKLVKHS